MLLCPLRSRLPGRVNRPFQHRGRLDIHRIRRILRQDCERHQQISHAQHPLFHPLEFARLRRPIGHRIVVPHARRAFHLLHGHVGFERLSFGLRRRLLHFLSDLRSNREHSTGTVGPDGREQYSKRRAILRNEGNRRRKAIRRLRDVVFP